MHAHTLSHRLARVEERAGIKRGLATLDDADLATTIEAVRRIVAARAAGTESVEYDLVLAHRAVELIATGSGRH